MSHTILLLLLLLLLLFYCVTLTRQVCCGYLSSFASDLTFAVRYVEICEFATNFSLTTLLHFCYFILDWQTPITHTLTFFFIIFIVYPIAYVYGTRRAPHCYKVSSWPFIWTLWGISCLSIMQPCDINSFLLFDLNTGALQLHVT